MTNETTTANVAETILQQLGNNRFVRLTGAKNLVNHGNGLSFRLPSNFAAAGINYVLITLTPADLYDVTFGKVRGTSYKVIETVEGVYNHNLRGVFTRTTGVQTDFFF